jgi:hypothetical protein
MVNRLIIIGMFPLMVWGQGDWREQPVGFGIGVGIGMISGNRIPPILLGLSLNRGKAPQPFTIGYGAFVTATMRIEYRNRRILKRKGNAV